MTEFVRETGKESMHHSWTSHSRKVGVKIFERNKPQELRNHGRGDRA